MATTEQRDKGDQFPDQQVGRVELTGSTVFGRRGTGAITTLASGPQTPAERPRPVPAGKGSRGRKGRLTGEASVLNALPDSATSTETREVTQQLVKQRFELAQHLNTLYQRFAETREKKRNDALRTLARDLAKLGGSISACGMTGEVKEFVTTLLMLEKVLPTADAGDDLTVSPIDLLSAWLNGKGGLEGEFDAA